MSKKNEVFVKYVLGYVEIFLTEYCEVREISENELENHVKVVFFPAHTILIVKKDAFTAENVEFGVTFCVGDELSLVFFGNFSATEYKFPKTMQKISANNLEVLHK